MITVKLCLYKFPHVLSTETTNTTGMIQTDRQTDRQLERYKIVEVLSITLMKWTLWMPVEIEALNPTSILIAVSQSVNFTIGTFSTDINTSIHTHCTLWKYILKNHQLDNVDTDPANLYHPLTPYETNELSITSSKLETPEIAHLCRSPVWSG